jgi:hypothetical protein
MSRLHFSRKKRDGNLARLLVKEVDLETSAKFLICQVGINTFFVANDGLTERSRFFRIKSQMGKDHIPLLSGTLTITSSLSERFVLVTQIA